jgi:hypothetical protein
LDRVCRAVSWQRVDQIRYNMHVFKHAYTYTYTIHNKSLAYCFGRI